MALNCSVSVHAGIQEKWQSEHKCARASVTDEATTEIKVLHEKYAECINVKCMHIYIYIYIHVNCIS